MPTPTFKSLTSQNHIGALVPLVLGLHETRQPFPIVDDAFVGRTDGIVHWEIRIF